MKKFVIIKIDKRYYLIDVTDRNNPTICKIGSFYECFINYVQYVEFVVVSPLEKKRTDFSLYIKKI